MKGIFCILIIFHHLFQNLYNDKNLFLRNCNNTLGGIGVGVFFFLSAFGLVVSYKKKGKEYIKKVLTKNIPLLYLTYVITNLLYFLVFNLGKLSVKDAIFKILGFNFLYGFTNMNVNAWFMSSLLLFYLLFCIVYLLFGKNTKRAAFIMALVTVIYNIAIAILTVNVIKQLYLYDRAILCFALGTIYATYYRQINNHLLKNFWEYILYAIALILFGLVTIEDISAIGTCLLIITLLQKYNIKSVILNLLGVISFYVYLLHGLFIRIFNNISPNEYFVVSTVLVVSIAASYLYYLIRKIFFKIFTIKKAA